MGWTQVYLFVVFICLLQFPSSETRPKDDTDIETANEAELDLTQNDGVDDTDIEAGTKAGFEFPGGKGPDRKADVNVVTDMDIPSTNDGSSGDSMNVRVVAFVDMNPFDDSDVKDELHINNDVLIPDLISSRTQNMHVDIKSNAKVLEIVYSADNDGWMKVKLIVESVIKLSSPATKTADGSYHYKTEVINSVTYLVIRVPSDPDEDNQYTYDMEYSSSSTKAEYIDENGVTKTLAVASANAQIENSSGVCHDENGQVDPTRHNCQEEHNDGENNN